MSCKGFRIKLTFLTGFPAVASFTRKIESLPRRTIRDKDRRPGYIAAPQYRRHSDLANNNWTQGRDSGPSGLAAPPQRSSWPGPVAAPLPQEPESGPPATRPTGQRRTPGAWKLTITTVFVCGVIGKAYTAIIIDPGSKMYRKSYTPHPPSLPLFFCSSRFSSKL